MKSNRYHVLLLITVCLFAGILLGGMGPAFAQERKAIPFQFHDLDGRPVRLSDFRGKWVLVNFWAYWCPICRLGIPTLNELNKREDFVVIGISLDYGDNVEVLREAIEEHGQKYHAQIAGGSRRDPKSLYRQVGPVDYFPTSYLYDPTGEIVMFIPGQLRKGQLLAFMDTWRTARAGTISKPIYAMNLARFEATLTQRFGAAGAQAFQQWHTLREELVSASVEDKLMRTNDFFNRRVRHMTDKQAWGQTEYWATPAETLGAGRGDSEDIALAKYFTLLSLDVPVDRLRLVYTRLRDEHDHRKNPVHIVLAYYASPARDPLVLDDHTPEIRPATQRSDLRPVYSFNSQYMPVQTDTSTYNQPAWQRTLQRARAEGFE